MHEGVSAPSCCAFIHRVAFKEVSGHWDLIKSGPGNWGLSACVTIHEAMSRISSCWIWLQAAYFSFAYRLRKQCCRQWHSGGTGRTVKPSALPERGAVQPQAQGRQETARELTHTLELSCREATPRVSPGFRVAILTGMAVLVRGSLRCGCVPPWNILAVRVCSCWQAAERVGWVLSAVNGHHHNFLREGFPEPSLSPAWIRLPQSPSGPTVNEKH